MSAAPVRRTKIVATMGPAIDDAALVRELVAAGVDIFRVNFSHATHEQFARWMGFVRGASADEGRMVAVLADLSGPKLRIGELEGHRPVQLVDGARFEITTKPIVGSAACVSTPYAGLPRDVRPADRVLLADGLIELRVDSVFGDTVVCTVVHGGTLGERKGINLPGVTVSSPAVTDKDKEDLAVALRGGADFVAVSFVRTADDVRAAREAACAIRPDVPICAKIEKPEAIDQLEEILGASDAVMVARGDLGVEMSPEKVPFLQKLIIRRATAHLIPVVTATQMLESMVNSPRPTRAEASDVANAIIDGTDAIMLSEETAAGKYPVEAVRTMVRIARETEPNFPPPERRLRRVESDSHAISRAALAISHSIDVRAIAAFTRSGFSARLVSKDRPPVPVYAAVPDDVVGRRLAIDWGVTPFVMEFTGSTETLLDAIEQELLRRGAVERGDAVVVVGGTPMGVRGRTNFLKIVRAGVEPADLKM